MINRSLHSIFSVLILLGVSLMTAACGHKEETVTEVRDITPEVEAFYKTYKHIPEALQSQLENKEITQETFDAAMEKEPLFFQFKAIEDLPENLHWEDGSDLPEFGSDQAVKGGTFRTFMQEFPRTLRLMGPDSNSHFRTLLSDATRPGLAPAHPDEIEAKPSGHRHIPFLAKEWSVDWENKTIYARIDPDARWSDGEKVTADDFLFFFFFASSDYIQAPFTKNFIDQFYTGITKYDDYTIAIHLAQAKPIMDSYGLILDPMPQHFFKEMGPDFLERYQWEFVPTTGPYIIKPEDIRKGQSIVLTRNKDWWAKDKRFWRQLFNYDKIQINIIRDESKSFESFLRGDIDLTGQASRRTSYWYEKLPDSHPLVQNGYIHKISFYNQRPRPNWGLWINSSQPLLNDQDIRIGIAHATNWQRIIDEYFRGDYERLNSTSQGYGRYTNEAIKGREFNVLKAQEYFTKAGFTQRGADGVLVNEQGERLSFTVSTGYGYFEDLLVILKEEALKAGLEFRIQILDVLAGAKKVMEKQHEIHFIAFNIGGLYPSYWQMMHSENAYDQPYLEDGVTPNPARKPKAQTNNLTLIANPELDHLIDRYEQAEKPDEIEQLAHQIEAIIHDEAVFIPGFAQPFYRLLKWRWMRYPEHFDVKSGDILNAGWPDGFFLGWIDEAMRKETFEAMKTGKHFDPVIKVYDQYSDENMKKE